MAGLRGKLFTALTGQAADVAGKADGDVHGMLLAVGGTSTKTQSGIDLSKAATKLGVSRRTVERWVKTAKTGSGQRPSLGHGKQLARKARQAATTIAGRRTALAESTLGKAITRRGARLAITGLQGPRANGREYLRFRTTMLDLDPLTAQAMLAAYQAGGDKGFMTWATTVWGDEYVPDWGFGEVASIEIQRPYGGNWR
jgi:transposase-like protein